MDVIFLHGPPAVGKLTVANALQERVPARLSDNHAAIDLAKTVIDFGAPGFWDLIHKLRLDLLAAAAATDLAYFLTTACCHSGDEWVINAWQDVMDKNGASFLPVHLICSPEAQAQRVGQPDRTARGKLDQIEGLDHYMTKNDYIPLSRDNCLTLDTTAIVPSDSAEMIIRHFNLPRRRA